MNFDELDPETCSSVSLACHKGYSEKLKQFLQEKKSTNVMDNRGWRALHHAANGGHVECVKLLLTAEDIDLNAVTFDRQTAISLTVKSSLEDEVKFEIAKILLEAGADPNVENEIQYINILNSAIETDYLPLIELLLPHVNINAVDDANGTCIHAAAVTNSVDVLRVLIKQNITCQSVIARSCTFLEAAIIFCSGNLEFLEILVKNPQGLILINTQDEFGDCPLSLACRENWEAAIHLLLDYGADPNLRNKKGYLPIHSVVVSFPDDVSDNSVFDRIFKLTRKNYLKEHKAHEIETSLIHSMIKNNKINMLKYLREQKCFESPDIFRCSAQSFSSGIFGEELDPLIVSFTELPLTSYFVTPLSYCCGKVVNEDDLIYFDTLLEWGSDVNATDNNTIPAIVMACEYSDNFQRDLQTGLTLIMKLIKAGADVMWKLEDKYPLPTLFLTAAIYVNSDYMEIILANTVPANIIYNNDSFQTILWTITRSYPFELEEELDYIINKGIKAINKYLPNLPNWNINEDLLPEIFSKVPKSLKNLAILEIRYNLYKSRTNIPLHSSIHEFCNIMEIGPQFEAFLTFDFGFKSFI